MTKKEFALVNSEITDLKEMLNDEDYISVLEFYEVMVIKAKLSTLEWLLREIENL